jgi:hypothetical protein
MRLISVVGLLIIGFVLGAVFGERVMGLFGGVAGTVRGMQIGVCETVKASQSAGILSPEQADKLFIDTVGLMRKGAPNVAESNWFASRKDCPA